MRQLGALITYLAEALGTDLIIIGDHITRSFLDVLLSGTAAYVGRYAPWPVIMGHPRQQRLSIQSREFGGPLRET